MRQARGDDRVSVVAITHAAEMVRSAPEVARERRPVPGHVERGHRQLEDLQLNRGARRYVS